MTSREARLAVVTALLALVGAFVAAYLSYARATRTSIMCPTSGCEVVERSSYAAIAGVPVAYLGVAGYASIVVTVWWRRLNAFLILAAVGMSLYLLLAQLLLIHAVCTWCLTSDGIAAGLLVLAALRRGGGTLTLHAPLLRHDLRLPDERARQRAHQGHARGSGSRRSAEPERS